MIHCAEGLGRTALIAILIYLVKNKNSNFDIAYYLIKTKRKGIKLNVFQEEFVVKLINLGKL